jgi:hypothetical protein
MATYPISKSSFLKYFRLMTQQSVTGSPENKASVNSKVERKQVFYKSGK